MERVLSLKKVDELFEDLAAKHVDIKGYCGTSAQELADKISSTVGLVSPFLVFFKYIGKLSGNTQRTFNNRSLAFSVVYAGIPVDDYPGQLLAKTNAEEIGLEVLSRINVFSKMPESGWLYNNFDKESVTYTDIEAEGADSFWGQEFHFDLKTLEPLIVTPEKWIDGDVFCTS
jgi:hypothetical protein